MILIQNDMNFYGVNIHKLNVKNYDEFTFEPELDIKNRYKIIELYCLII